MTTANIILNVKSVDWRMIFLLALPGIFIISYAFKIGRDTKNKNYFIEIGKRLKLPVKTSDDRNLPFVEGKYGNLQIGIYSVVRYGARRSRLVSNDIYFKQVTITTLNGKEFDFHLKKETFVERIGTMLGYQDIKTGCEDFDKKFILQSYHEEKTKAVFDKNVCNELAENNALLLSPIDFGNNLLIYEERGLIQTQYEMERILKILELCIPIAKNIERVAD